jgi:hypothetical protein
MGAAFHGVRFGLFPVIAQPHSDAMAGAFERKTDELVVPQMIRVPNNIRAGLVYSQDHEHAFTLRERIPVQERPDERSHRREVPGVARKFDFLLFHQPGWKQNAERMRRSIQVLNRKRGGQPAQA